MSFLDASIEGAITLVADTLKVLPQEGYIQGQEFVTLERLVTIMSETDSLLNAASKVKNGIPVCDALFPLTSVQAVGATVIEEAVQCVVESGETIPDALVVVSPVSILPQQVVMLPPITVPSVQAFNKAEDVKIAEKPDRLGITSLPFQIRTAPVLKPREALKTNSLMF